VCFYNIDWEVVLDRPRNIETLSNTYVFVLFACLAARRIRWPFQWDQLDHRFQQAYQE